jgi:transcriptional regulator with XRE-family HTH domain
MTSERRQQFLQQFGRRVRAARILKGLTLQECAEQAGISYSNLSVIERGRRSMYVENLAALATVLDVCVPYLLGEDDGKRPPRRRRTRLGGATDEQGDMSEQTELAFSEA